jgi:hypothetical protein
MLTDNDPEHGLVSLIGAAMSLAARELNTLAAARSAGIRTAEVYTPFNESLTLLTQRAQDTSQLRADLAPDDLPRLMAMLISTLWTMDPSADGRHRYLALMFEGLTPAAAHPLPSPATPIKDQRKANWPALIR